MEDEEREAEETLEALNLRVERAKPLRGSRVPARRALLFQSDGACPEQSLP